MRPERSPRVRTALGLCGSPSGCSHGSHGKLGTTTCDIGGETRRTAEPRGPLRARGRRQAKLRQPPLQLPARTKPYVDRGARLAATVLDAPIPRAASSRSMRSSNETTSRAAGRSASVRCAQAEQVFDQLPTALRKLRLLPTIGTVAARVGGAERTRSERRRVPVGFDTAVTMPTESDGRSCPQDTNLRPSRYTSFFPRRATVDATQTLSKATTTAPPSDTRQRAPNEGSTCKKKPEESNSNPGIRMTDRVPPAPAV